MKANARVADYQKTSVSVPRAFGLGQGKTVEDVNFKKTVHILLTSTSEYEKAGDIIVSDSPGIAVEHNRGVIKMSRGQYRMMIENMQPFSYRGNLRAIFDVRISTAGGDWVIRDCRIIQQPGQRPWFSLPVISWEDETGQICHKTILALPAGIKRRISEAALSAYYKLEARAA